MIKINLNEEQQVDFSIEIEGAKLEKATPRLVLKENNLSVLIDGNIISEDNKNYCRFNIFGLKNLFNEEKITGSIEILLDEKYFKPWEGEIFLIKPVKIQISDNKIQEKKETTIKIQEKKEQEVKILEVKKEIVETKKDQKLYYGKKVKYKNKDYVINEILDKGNHFVIELQGNNKKIKLKKNK